MRSGFGFRLGLSRVFNTRVRKVHFASVHWIRASTLNVVLATFIRKIVSCLRWKILRTMGAFCSKVQYYFYNVANVNK